MLIMDRNQNKIYAWTKHRIHGMIVCDGRTCNSNTVEDKKFLRERMFNMTNLELKKHANDVRKGIIEGVHSAVCDCLCTNYPVPVKKIGMQDVFGESGSAAALAHKYGLDVEGVFASVKSFL